MWSSRLSIRNILPFFIWALIIGYLVTITITNLLLNIINHPIILHHFLLLLIKCTSSSICLSLLFSISSNLDDLSISNPIYDLSKFISSSLLEVS